MRYYTRRLFGGRHPLCGIGVLSVIEKTSNPAENSALTAASLPEPGPFTNTSTLRSPISYASFAAFSAQTWEAYGVFFFEPRKPFFPADDQQSAFPYISDIVTRTLLKDALINALPWTSTTLFFFTFFFATYIVPIFLVV